MKQDELDYLDEIDREMRFFRATGKTRLREAEDSSTALGCALLILVVVAMLLITVGIAYLGF